jgi:hypothetical protein
MTFIGRCLLEAEFEQWIQEHRKSLLHKIEPIQHSVFKEFTAKLQKRSATLDLLWDLYKLQVTDELVQRVAGANGPEVLEALSRSLAPPQSQEPVVIPGPSLADPMILVTIADVVMVRPLATVEFTQFLRRISLPVSERLPADFPLELRSRVSDGQPFIIDKLDNGKMFVEHDQYLARVFDGVATWRIHKNLVDEFRALLNQAHELWPLHPDTVCGKPEVKMTVAPLYQVTYDPSLNMRNSIVTPAHVEDLVDVAYKQPVGVRPRLVIQ